MERPQRQRKPTSKVKGENDLDDLQTEAPLAPPKYTLPPSDAWQYLATPEAVRTHALTKSNKITGEVHEFYKFGANQ